MVFCLIKSKVIWNKSIIFWWQSPFCFTSHQLGPALPGTKLFIGYPSKHFRLHKVFSPVICLGFGVWGTAGSGVGLSNSWIPAAQVGSAVGKPIYINLKSMFMILSLSIYRISMERNEFLSVCPSHLLSPQPLPKECLNFPSRLLISN